jgi:hypothetical protein
MSAQDLQSFLYSHFPHIDHSDFYVEQAEDMSVRARLKYDQNTCAQAEQYPERR